MRFVCTHSNLLQGLTQITPLAGRNPQLPVLQYVLLEVSGGVLYLMCTDLEVGARVVVAGKAERDGSCTVAARQLLEYVQHLSGKGPVSLEVKSKGLVVEDGEMNARFPVSAADDFPLLPIPKESEKGFVLDGRRLSQAISRTLFAAAKDDTRPEIHSLFIAGDETQLRLAATDSFRLAEQKLPSVSKKSFSFLLPAAAAQEVMRLFGNSDEFVLYVKDNYVAFFSDSIRLSSRLIDGSYPDYSKIIPEKSGTAGTIRRDDFIRALRAVGVFVSRDVRRVQLSIRPKDEQARIEVTGGDRGAGEAVVDFKGEGDSVDVLCNINYLIEGILHIPGDGCDIGLNGAHDPIVIRPTGNSLEYLYIVMPIQAG